MREMREKIEVFMSKVRLFIDNINKDSDIKATFALFGFGDDRITEGGNLYQTAENLIAKQIKEYGEQYQATEELNTKWKEADVLFTFHRKIARFVLRKEDQKQKALGLKGRKKLSLSGWLHQAQVFYKNILDDVQLQEQLAQTNLSLESLQQAQRLLQEVSDLDSAQEKEKSEAVEATKERNQALDNLNEWYSEVKELAFIAFEDEPEKLKALGFV